MWGIPGGWVKASFAEPHPCSPKHRDYLLNINITEFQFDDNCFAEERVRNRRCLEPFPLDPRIT